MMAETAAANQLDGAQILNDLYEVIGKYVVMPTEAFHVATTLWIAATHAAPAFETAPRLVITSPEKRCGKSRLLDVIAGTCHDPLVTMNASVAALFRSIGGVHPPTLLLDEADTIFGSKKAAENNEDLRGLLNAGHQRGRTTLRCVGPNQIPTPFETFAFAALGGIGRMPDTITDRGICGVMRRRKTGEEVSSYRSRRDGPVLAAIRDRLAEWATAHLDELRAAEPKMPVEDRAADTWEPLISIADAAGGDWPKRARDACSSIVNEADSDDDKGSAGTKLLADIRQIFKTNTTDFVPTAELIAALHGLDESPWKEFLTARGLATKLKLYAVRPGHDTTGKIRGYQTSDFKESFDRYLPSNPSEASEPSETGGDQQKPSDGSKPSDASIRQKDLSVRRETPDQDTFLTDLTDLTDNPTEIGQEPPDADGEATLFTISEFTPPSGPGRCGTCGHHIATQNHRPDCTTQQTSQEPVTEAETLSMFDIPTLTYH